jgi:hypothetical protein
MFMTPLKIKFDIKFRFFFVLFSNDSATDSVTLFLQRLIVEIAAVAARVWSTMVIHRDGCRWISTCRCAFDQGAY